MTSLVPSFIAIIASDWQYPPNKSFPFWSCPLINPKKKFSKFETSGQID